MHESSETRFDTSSYQVAQPRQNGEGKRRGLTEGTIRRLRRISFHAAETMKDTPTQCAVCLEHYEEGDQLIVSHTMLKVIIRPPFARHPTLLSSHV